MESWEKAQWKERLRKMFKKYNMSEPDIEYFGDPWFIASAENFLDKRRNELHVVWLKEYIDGGFGINVEVPSKNHEPHVFRYHLVRSQNHENELVVANRPTHDCDYTLWEEDAERDENLEWYISPCVHRIASELFIQREAPRIISKYLEKKGIREVLHVKRKYKKYGELERFFVLPKYPLDVLRFYRYILKEMDGGAIEKRDFLYSFLKNRDMQAFSPLQRKWYTEGI